MLPFGQETALKFPMPYCGFVRLFNLLIRLTAVGWCLRCVYLPDRTVALSRAGRPWKSSAASGIRMISCRILARV